MLDLKLNLPWLMNICPAEERTVAPWRKHCSVLEERVRIKADFEENTYPVSQKMSQGVDGYFETYT